MVYTITGIIVGWLIGTLTIKLIRIVIKGVKKKIMKEE